MFESSTNDGSKKELQEIDREPFTEGRIARIVNSLSFLFLVVFGVIFFFIAMTLNQEFNSWNFLTNRVYVLILLITCAVATILVHETIHGVFTWVFIHRLPPFGCKNWYPYIALPRDSQVKRNEYIVMCLAPFVVISILSIIIMPFVSGPVARGLFILATFNASSCSADVLSARRLMKYDNDVLLGVDNNLDVVIYRKHVKG